MLAFRRLQSRHVLRSMSSVPALHIPYNPSNTDESFVSVQQAHTEITTLPNGVRVASVEAHGNLSSVGVFVQAGSRDEQAGQTGSAHVAKFLFRKGTESRSAFRTVREIERMGGSMGIGADVDTTIFSGNVLRPMAIDLLAYLAEWSRPAAINHYHFNEATAEAIAEMKEKNKNELELNTRLLDETAYRGASVGRPLYVRESDYKRLTAESVGAFWQDNLVGATTIVGGVNVDHGALVERASGLFGDLSPESRPTPRTLSPYTGGDHRFSTGAVETTVGIGFEGFSWSHDHVVDQAVLGMLLGSGWSFSVGGPGKGTESRLFENVLCEGEGNFLSAHCNFGLTSDSGSFVVQGQTKTSAHGNEMIEALCGELDELRAGQIADTELHRSKNQLKNRLYSNLNIGATRLDDLTRQLFATNKYRDMADISAKIDAVTAPQLQAAARKLLSSPLTFVANGDVSGLVSAEEISSALSP